ncbi:MAG: hypothetical protein ACE5E5_15280 [Phycisphaerae bacterium]
MSDWIRFIVASGIVAPWLLAGAWMLAERAYKATTHCWRMWTNANYREAEIQFRVDLAEAGLDSQTIRIRSILWWSSVLATGGFLSSDIGWICSAEWLWSMSAPLIVLEFAAILIAAGRLNLTAVSFAQRLSARREPAVSRDTGDDDGWDDLLQAAEALSAQYEAIVGGDRHRAGE